MKQILCLFAVLLVAVSAQNTFVVKASASANATSWALLGFYPSALTVATGDTVRFSVEGQTTAIAIAPTQPAAFSDSVNYIYNTILAPKSSPIAVDNLAGTFCSGILQVGSTFDFTMTLAGVYSVFDVLHPLSTPYTITVVGGSAPASPAAVASSVDQLIAVARAGVQSTISGNPAVSASTATKIANPDAGSTVQYWEALLGFGTPELKASLNALVPVNVTVAPGDVVQFRNGDIQSHMIAFDPTGAFSACSNAYPAPASSFYAANGNSNGFSGAAFLSSGVLTPNQVFTVRFTTTGSFAYLDCQSGARGFVNVITPPTTTPAPTKKKDGPVSAGRAFGQIFVILAILIIISIIGIFLIILIDLPCREIFTCGGNKGKSPA